MSSKSGQAGDLTLERDLDEQQRALDEDQHTGDVQLSKGVDGHDGGENSKDGVDVGPEHGDARQEIVQLVGFVEGVRQLLDLRIFLVYLAQFPV